MLEKCGRTSANNIGRVERPIHRILLAPPNHLLVIRVKVLPYAKSSGSRACPERSRMGISYYCFVAGILSSLGICAKRTKIIPMAAVATGSMIRREIGDDHVCVLTFDRPESGANIFDAATLDELNEHLDFVENESSLRGLIITSAKKSIFVAGADLKTLLKQAQTGDLRAFIAEGQRILNRLAELRIPTVAAIHGACAGGGYEVTLACDHR
ncbi:MAG: enoyl-CoA hydratase/isomerase family protein, partial [Verrucomicrobia bacterium]